MKNPYARYVAVCPDTKEHISHYLCDGEEHRRGHPTVVYGFEKQLFLAAMRRCVGIPTADLVKAPQ